MSLENAVAGDLRSAEISGGPNGEGGAHGGGVNGDAADLLLIDDQALDRQLPVQVIEQRGEFCDGGIAGESEGEAAFNARPVFLNIADLLEGEAFGGHVEADRAVFPFAGFVVIGSGDGYLRGALHRVLR